MLPSHLSLNRRPMFLAFTAGALTVLPCVEVRAEGWPTQPDLPLLLGEIHTINNTHAVALASDGSLWSAWGDGECFGSLRVQRVDAQGQTLGDEALTFFRITTCIFREARAAACVNGDALVALAVGGTNSSGPLNVQPITRLSPAGDPVWPSPIVLSPPPNNPGGTTGKIGQLLCAPNDDAIVAWHAGTVVFVSRYNAAGEDVWSGPAVVTTLTGSTKRLIALIADEQGDFIVVWDEPGGPYVRTLLAARVSASGQVLWPQPANIAPTFSGSSRHTDPVAMPDGAGGVIVVYTQGHEQAAAPMPLRLQHVSHDGALMLEPEGRRVSLDPTRQYDPIILREPASGDALIFWRDGGNPQSVRAQRMTIAGQRVWSDSGVLVKNLNQIAGGHKFDAVIVADNGEPSVRVVIDDLPAANDPNPARLHLHRMDLAGNVDAQTHAISGNALTHDVRCASFGDGFVASWLQDAPSFPEHVVAQRVNADGTIGLPPVIGDINGDGSVNVLDLLSVINAWGACPPPPPACAADIAPQSSRDGVVNVLDLLMIINNWG